VNPLTGSPAAVSFEGAPPAGGSLIDHALALVSGGGAALGFATGDAPSFVPDPRIQKTSAGTSVVHLHQFYHGVPLFQMARSVQFSPDGTDIVGDAVSMQGIEVSTEPKAEVEDAMRVAAQYLATSEENEPERTDHWGQPLPAAELDVSDYEPEALVKFELPAEPTVLDKGPFGDVIPAHLVLFYQGDAIRLAWNFLVTMPNAQGQYRVLVAADREENSEVLYCRSTASSAVSARGRVYTHNPGTGDREFIDFPRKLADYLIRHPWVQLPNPFPPSWVAEVETDGNATRAVLVKGGKLKTLKGKTVEGNLVFDPKGGSDEDQKVLNIFYFCNFMHDFFYMLGFIEAEENFEGPEAVLARSHPVPVYGTANMLTPVHGQPTMNMGLVASTKRHTALDSDVVFHEFCHGVSNRLIGGRQNVSALEQPQSRGMGEGWSDYFALTIYNFGKPQERFVTGDWVTGNPKGIRRFPYDSNFPENFGHIANQTDEHVVGEVWCAALMEMNRSLGKALGSPEEGHLWGWQLVVDSFKLMPANPSFLDARDSILRALDDARTKGRLTADQHQAARKAIWTTFAKFGMGPGASCHGASLDGIQTDFNLPQDLQGGDTLRQAKEAGPAGNGAMAALNRLASEVLKFPEPVRTQTIAAMAGVVAGIKQSVK
jgi:extracellular elastinolytic metalloproteinase